MLRRLSIPVLLLALLPSLLDGWPIYLCRITGIKSLVQRCAQTESKASCPNCAAFKRVGAPRFQLSVPADADRNDLSCCDVSILRWSGSMPGSETFSPANLDVGFPVVARFLRTPPPQDREVLIDSRAGPKEGLSLFLLNLSFLC